MTTSRTEIMTPERADYLARNFVNGLRKHGRSGKMEPASGEFHERFLSHPWVRESITEGWDRELRGHLIHVCKIRLMSHEALGDIESLMPDASWVSSTKHDAERYRKAAQWREKNGGNGIDVSGLLSRFSIGAQP